MPASAVPTSDKLHRIKTSDELIVNEFDKSDYSDGNLVTRQATFNGLAKRGGGGVLITF